MDRPIVRSPADLAAELSRRVIGQDEAVRETAIALSKKLAGLTTGNILMIGSSGTGKTTLMRAVEELLAADPETAGRSTVVRLHANVLAEESERGRPGEAILERLAEEARRRMGGSADRERLRERVAHGIVFVDEVDKIRAHVGGEPNVRGIRAQEALLTLVENEAIPFTWPAWAGGETEPFDSRGLLFICAGAFEGLYESVFDRVTVGEDRGALQAISVVGEAGELREEMPFRLRDWVRPQDLFAYGLSPQFLSRFDALVLLEELGADELQRILEESPESRLRQARDYFAGFGVELEVTEAARRRLAEEAARQPRIGARALAEVFRRVIRQAEFDPRAAASNGRLVLDRQQIEELLAQPR